MLYGRGSQNCSHNGFPVCTVVKDPVTKQERWLFDGMILRSQLLVILSRRVRDTTPAGIIQLDVELTTTLSMRSCGGMVLFE